MNVGQATALICHGLAAARSKGEIVGEYGTVGDLLQANPEITREVYDWLYALFLTDLAKPEMQVELKKRRCTAEEAAREGVPGLLHEKLTDLPIVGMYFYVGDHLMDTEMRGYPYPFSFGRCPLTLDPNFGM